MCKQKNRKKKILKTHAKILTKSFIRKLLHLNYKKIENNKLNIIKKDIIAKELIVQKFYL